jgi:hypothetical protein
VHVNSNIDGDVRAKFAEVSVSSSEYTVELHRFRRLGFAVHYDHARLRLVREYERGVGIDSEYERTG